MQEQDKKICPGCGGTGQISFFQGESRFLLTMEECPECCGTGTMPDEKSNGKEKAPAKKNENRK